MAMIRRNLQELEKIIAITTQQEQKMGVVFQKITVAGASLGIEVKQQEKEILDYVIATAKEKQPQNQDSSLET
jgi:hypothetical protein